MRLWITLAAAALGALCAPVRADAQANPDGARPRAVVDSTYAVRAELDRLAEGIRRGAPDVRRGAGAELAGEARETAAAARQRSRGRPNPALGDLWDFRLTVSDIQPVGRDGMRVAAAAMLATDAAGEKPVTLLFQRRGGEWVLASHEGLTAWLRAQSQRFREGKAK